MNKQSTGNVSLVSLSKENFWNELTKKHPEEMKAFCRWIDEYKKRVNWDLVIRHNLKYHHLPIAMQIGIFIQYCLETPHRYELVEGMPSTIYLFAESIKAWFAAEAICAANMLKEQMEGRVHRNNNQTPVTVVNIAEAFINETANNLQQLDELYHPDNFDKN